MGGSKMANRHPAVFFNIGGDSSNDINCRLCFFGIQLALIIGGFASLNFVYDAVDGLDCQALTPKGRISKLFYLFAAFSSSGKASDKISCFRHSC